MCNIRLNPKKCVNSDGDNTKIKKILKNEPGQKRQEFFMKIKKVMQWEMV